MKTSFYTAEYNTRFNPATDTTGGSITVFHNGKQKTYPYVYSLSELENHTELCENMLKDFFKGSDIVYSNVRLIKELKKGYKFKGTIEVKDKD